MSFKKMLSHVQKRFYWPGMHRDIDRFVRECPVCQEHRTSTVKPAGLLQPHVVPARPFQVVSMDFITSLPPTKHGHDSILTIVDRYSKMVLLLPVSMTIDAAATAKLFFDQFICKHGMPEKIISDRDVCFTSLFW